MTLVFSFGCSRFYIVLHIFEFLIFVMSCVESLNKMPRPTMALFSVH